MKKFVVFYVVLLLSFPALAENVKVVDGDSLLVNGKKVRLIGIDAPEYKQICNTQTGDEYLCGQKAMDFVQNLITKGQKRGEKVKCVKKNTDRYKRDLSTCYIGNVDINKEIVSAGWAVAYRNDSYIEQQKDAKLHKRGIWQGRFMLPELYRILQKNQKTQK